MAPSPSSGLRRPAPWLAVEAAVDQPNHGARARVYPTSPQAWRLMPCFHASALRCGA